MRTPRVDRTGHVYGRLTVISQAPTPEGERWIRWNCHCACGNDIVISSHHLPRHPQSCGCLHREATTASNSTHGATRSHAEHADGYDIWAGMVRRCHDPKFRNYRNYGAKGTRVCDRWHFGEAGMHGFQCFMADMGPRPSSKHTIDRIDSHGHYEPGNCRWATMTEQQRNRTNNRIVIFDGRGMAFAEACELAGLKRTTVAARLDRGWSHDRAFGRAK